MGVQEFARHVLANKEDYSPIQRKRVNSNFARNAAKWHELGGLLDLVNNSYAMGGNIKFQNMFHMSPQPNQVQLFNNGGDLTNAFTGPFASGANVYEQGGITQFDINPLEVTGNYSLPQYNYGNFAQLDTDGLIPVQSNNINGNFNYDTSNFYNNLAQLDTNGLVNSQQNNINSNTQSLFQDSMYPGMYAPALFGVGQLISDYASTPETLNLPTISVERVNQRMNYRPIDREYIANNIRGQAGSARRALLNTAGGNRATATASLLASDANAQRAIGDAYRAAEQINQDRRNQALQFNRQTDALNAQNNLQAQLSNLNSSAAIQDYNARSRAARRNAIREGLQSLSQNISSISRNRFDRDRLNNMFPDYSVLGNYKG